VHEAVRTDVAYIERDLEPDVFNALRFNRRVYPLGAGKTAWHCPALDTLPKPPNAVSQLRTELKVRA
jgi:hypothetical protein